MATGILTAYAIDSVDGALSLVNHIGITILDGLTYAITQSIQQI